MSLNLLPTDVQQSQARTRRVRAWAWLLAPGAAGLLALGAFDALERTRLEDLQQQSVRIQEEVDQHRAEVRRLTAEVGDASLQVQRSDALRAKRSWSAMLTLLGLCMPRTCWLACVTTDPELPPATSITAPAPTFPATAATAATPAKSSVAMDGPRKLRLSGYALEAVDPLSFVANLKQAGVFQTVTLERSVLDAAARPPRFRFDLSCEW